MHFHIHTHEGLLTLNCIPPFVSMGLLDTVTDTYGRLSCSFFARITILLYSCFNYVYKIPQCCTG
jgi:hypothetical protein